MFDDLSAVHDVVDQDASLEFVRAEIRVAGGLDDLSFVDAVKVAVSSNDPGTTLPKLTMYQCDGNCAPDGKTLKLTAGDAKNVIEYLKANSLKIDLDFQGEIPAASWTMDIDVCLKGSASHSVSF